MKQQTGRVAIAIAVMLPMALVQTACSDGSASQQRSPHGRLLVLGLDGMDYGLVREMIQAGQLPNFAALGKEGGFVALQTSMPPQSPTAWSDVITGASPAAHGIFDFVHRDPHTLQPYLSTSKVDPPRRLKLGALAIPMGGGGASLLRREKPFWWYLSKKGVPATVIKIPAHFPPTDDGGAHVLAGMGTPDLLGTYGTFSIFTDDPELLQRKLPGGRAERLEHKSEGRMTASLAGPPSPFSSADRPLQIPVEVLVDQHRRGAMVRLGDAEELLGTGEWSPFVNVSFPVVPGMSSLKAVVRVFLKSVTPHVVVYVSPLNIDPEQPALPISSPPDFAGELADAAGTFFTQGMPEESKALSAGVLSRDDYLAQAEGVMRERKRLLQVALDRFHDGLLFYYFSSTDQIAHMFFREHDPNHPARKPSDDRYRDVIRNVYREADEVVGQVRHKLGPKDLLLVMSDHGFGSAGRLFDLNLWLTQQGFLVLRDKRGPGPFGHVDWARTQAYGLGLNGLYINLRGREEYGTVDPKQREQVIQRLTRALKAVRDPETGQQVVTEIVRPDREGTGAALDRAPDLIIGYGAGFKVSDTSAIGAVGSSLFAINHNEWSGDHCVDHRLVPGILLANRKLRNGSYSLHDIAPTVLRYFGVEPPSVMVGKSVLADAR